MSRLTFLFLLTFTFSTTLPAQITFERIYGGSEDDWGYSVLQMQDGGYIVAGGTESFNVDSSQVFWVWTDSSGQMSSWKALGGSGNETAHSIATADDGGHVMAGYTTSSSYGSRDVYLIRLDSFHESVWARRLGGSDAEEGKDVRQVDDGGFIIAGYSESFGAGSDDVYLIKTDATGQEVWSKTFGGGGNDVGNSVQQTEDGGYIIAGYTASFGAGGLDVYLVKTDASGEETWSRTFGGNDDDEGYSVLQTDDGGYIIAGWTWSFGTGSDVYLIKTDASGEEEWSSVIGGSDVDRGYSVQRTDDGGYIIAGRTTSIGAGFYDVYLLKTDASGQEEWSRAFGGSDLDAGYSVQQTGDGGYIIAGETDSFGAGDEGVYLIKTDPDGLVGIGSGKPRAPALPRSFLLLQNYPNPFNPLTAIAFEIPGDTPPGENISLSVYDLRGRRVRRLCEGKYAPGRHEVAWDGRNDQGSRVPSGAYLYVLRAGGRASLRKMLIVK